MGLKMQRKKKQRAIAIARILLEDAKTAATPEEAATNRANAATVLELHRHRDPAAMELYTEATAVQTPTVEITTETTMPAVETPTVEVAAAAAPVVEDLKAQAAVAAVKAVTKKTPTKKTTWKKKK